MSHENRRLSQYSECVMYTCPNTTCNHTERCCISNYDGTSLIHNKVEESSGKQNKLPVIIYFCCCLLQFSEYLQKKKKKCIIAFQIYLKYIAFWEGY